MGFDRETVDIEQAGKALHAVLDQHLALASAMHAKRRFAVRRLHDIERHHAGKHPTPAKPGP
jgi:hypothetical protein